MQSINKILIISLLTIISLIGFSQETKHDAVFHNVKKEYVINEDGSMDFTYRKEIELISNRSFFRDYGESFIVYNPEFQTLTINEAYTIRKDGSILHAPDNAFNEVLPSGCTDCARYNGMKEMVVTHTGLEYNATIVLDYTIHSKPEFITELSEIINFVEYSPINNYDVFVKVPTSIELQHRMLNIRLAPMIEENDNFITYHWNIENLSQTISESYMPTYEEMYPVLILSTFKDTQNSYFKLVEQEALRVNNLPESKSTLNEIINKEKNSLENILAIRDYVVDYIRYNNISLIYNNYKIATPATVWQSRCGNETEKAILLSNMLNTAGFNAIPVTFTKPQLHSKEVGNLDIIATWGVRVNYDNDKQIIISPLRKNNISMDVEYPNYYMYPMSATVETFRPTAKKKIPTQVNFVCDINIAINGDASGEMKLSIASEKLPTFTIENNTNKAADVTKNIKCKVNSVNFENQILDLALNATNISIKDMNAGYYSFELPETKYGIAVNPAYLNTTRLTDVVCGKTNESYKYKITLPAKYKYIGKDVVEILETNFGKVEIKITSKKNVIEVERSIIINNDRINTNEYDDFRKMMILWNNEIYKNIIIKK